jgi:uncharacterized membrane protein
LRRPDLVLVVLLTIGCVIVGITPSWDPVIRASGALLLTCLLPGYALTAALLPPPRIGRPERITLSLGLSLALAAVGAVYLNLTPTGINPETWATLLGVVTLVACVVALGQGPGAPPPRITWVAGLRRLIARRTLIPVLMFGLAATITIGALQVTAESARNEGRVPFTQVWLLPTEEPGSVVVGIHNAEQEPIVARLVISAGDEPKAEWSSIPLEVNETWEQQVDVSGFVGTGVPIVAQLYRETSADTPFRETRLWPE